MNDLTKLEKPSYNHTHTLHISEIPSHDMGVKRELGATYIFPSGFIAGFPIGDAPHGWTLLKKLDGFTRFDVNYLLWSKD